MKTTIIYVVLLLAACATKPDAVVPPPEKIVHIDARLLEPCEPLIRVPDGASFEDILGVTVSNFEIYKDCSNKQRNSVVIIKKFSNITTGDKEK